MEIRAGKNTKSFSEPKPKVPRDRSLPSSRPFNIAAIFTALYFLGLISTITSAVLFFKESNPLSLKFMLGGLGISIVTGIIAFFKRPNVAGIFVVVHYFFGISHDVYLFKYVYR